MSTTIKPAQRIGIRAETKHMWERRASVVPEHVRELRQTENLAFTVQRSPIRLQPELSEHAYRAAGADIVTELGDNCPIVLGVKEMPADAFHQGRVYMFFSHTYKGQRAGMHMLQTMMDNGNTLLDYEHILSAPDAKGKRERLVAFGEYAGLVGMTDSLHVFGRRMEEAGFIGNPFAAIKQTTGYRGSDKVKADLRRIADSIRKNGLPNGMLPVVVGITGRNGRCASGAQQIIDAMNPVPLEPNDLLDPSVRKTLSPNTVYKVLFDRVGVNGRYNRIDGKPESDADFLADPNSYASTMGRYLPYLSMFINCVLWESGQPALVTKPMLFDALNSPANRLSVVGDVTCDIWSEDGLQGGMACTPHATDVESPFYVYSPSDGSTQPGWIGNGVVVNALETMPCELPWEASNHFSSKLKPFLPAIARANYDADMALGLASLPIEMQSAVILWQGKLTPSFDTERVRARLAEFGRTPVWELK